MALIQTETFTNEEGVEMLREIYDTMVIERPAEEPEPAEEEATEMEQLQADIAYIKMKMKGM